MNKYIIILFIICSFLFGRGSFIDYHKTGYYTYYGSEKINYSTNSFSGSISHYSFGSTYEIRNSLKNSELIELNYYNDVLSINNLVNTSNTTLVEHKLVLRFLKENRNTLTPNLFYIQSGGFDFNYFFINKIPKYDFTNTVVPLYNITSKSTNAVTFAKLPGIYGGDLGLTFNLGLSIRPTSLLHINTLLNAYGAIKVSLFNNDSYLPTAFLSYGFNYSLSFLFNFNKIQPYISYHLFFLENESGLIDPNYNASVPIRHLFMLGVYLKFTLISLG